MANVYKSKKGFMPLGTLAIAVAVSIGGCLLSFLYLKINRVCPSVYLCMAAAVGFGAAMGGIAYFLIKIMKIRSKSSAVVGIILGCIVFTIFKWALYVHWDTVEILHNYSKYEKAFTYFEFNYDFADENGNIYSDSDIELVAEFMQGLTAKEYMDLVVEGGATAYIADAKEKGYDYTVSELSAINSFDFFYEGYVNEDNITESIKKSQTMSAYDYYYDYLGNGESSSVLGLITNPKVFWEKIKEINEYGRWSVSSSYSSATSTNADNVKGIMLWITWIGEIFFICAPAVAIAKNRAAKPFIESERKWAQEIKSDGFMLKPPILMASVRNSFISNPSCIFSYEPLLIKPGTGTYLKVEIAHSTNFDENYISLMQMTYNVKNKRHVASAIAKYVYVDKDFIYNLYKHCNQHMPAMLINHNCTTPISSAAPNTVNPDDFFANPASRTADKNEQAAVPTFSTVSTTPTVSELQRDEKSQEDILKELDS